MKSNLSGSLPRKRERADSLKSRGNKNPKSNAADEDQESKEKEKE